MNKKKLILSLFFLISLFSIISCVSTNKENINIEKPNLMDKKIDDYNIEISGTENIKYIYFYRSPTGLHFSGEPVNNNFIQETISNISFSGSTDCRVQSTYLSLFVLLHIRQSICKFS